MKLLRRLLTRESSKPEPRQKRPQPKTIDHLLHYLWTERAGNPGYDTEEKRLWMTLQRFVERKGGLRAPIEDYKS